MGEKKSTPGGRAKKMAEVSFVRSLAAEYLARVETRYEDENVWLT